MTKSFQFFSRLFIFTLFLSVVFSNTSFPTTNYIQKIKDRGYLIVAMIGHDAPPYEMKNSQGQAIGIDVSLAKDIAKDLGVDLKILRTATTYDDVVEQVFQGKADIGISNLSITLGRAEKVNYSSPYVSLKKTVLLNRANFFRTRQRQDDSLESFFRNGHKLGVMKGTSYVEFARLQFPQAEIVEYSNEDELIKALAVRQIAGIFWDEFELERILILYKEGPIRYIAVVMDVSSDKAGIAVPKGDLNFLRWINTFLQLNRKPLEISDLLKIHLSNLNKK